MNPLEESARALRAHGRKALVAFFTAGYPDEATFVAMVQSAADAGVDIVEIGIPFSDPIADGPVIQAASTAALARGMTLRRALSLIAELGVDTPLVVMSYVNPLLAMGVEAFAKAAARARVSGVILPDVSFEESPAFREPLTRAGLIYIDLVAPTSSAERVEQQIARGAKGFVYLVSVTGVTGAGGTRARNLTVLAGRVRNATRTPVYAGFGITESGTAVSVARSTDGVIIGSRLMELAAEGDLEGAPGRVGDFLATVRGALDREAD